MNTSSLRTRLLLAGGVGLVLVSALATWWLGAMYERSARTAMDQRLGNELIAVLALAESDAQGRLQLRRDLFDERYQRVFSGAYWQVQDAHGRPLGQSRSLWDETLQLPAALHTGPAQGYDTRGPLDAPLRALAQQVTLPRVPTPLRVVVATDRSDLDAQVSAFRQRTALALAVLIALWFAVLVTQVHYGLRPLAELGRIAGQVRNGENVRFPQQGLVKEVAPLAAQLNDLLDHHQRMVVRARRSAEDLAHALKTPLTVLVTEADGDGSDWRQTLRSETARMQASIERYLAAGIGADSQQRTAVAPVIDALCTLMQRVHNERGLVFAQAPDAQGLFAGAREDLEEMLGNLLDNAGKWAAHRVSIRVRHIDATLRIEVQDDGPGLPDADLQRVLERGVRLDQRAAGSGLGLAIVADIAESHGGTLVLANAEPGLRATLTLPAG
ncbi:HAMP domain-containing sensor histidine kinase [Stenotrophomonas sp. BIGb0135]|uniref:sensor histidine kinase n=1 Tax=Stenotrophomonas sp. BIGb0135 TaxID=2940620 RepID=UPI0021696F9A|nr:HAMP domain-containing sensor histidine kinase [Stenotrophomonas sp. BIGb0135]MCS4236200.1 signal transduction histidine kinase [Stenotrophomonas sp. BIGb0135]